MGKSLSKNAVLNCIKTLMSIIFPLITYPYITRVLQPEYLGKINYANSIVSYYSLIAALGVSTYAVREVAKCRNNKEKLNELVNEIFTVNMITTGIAYVLLFLTIGVVAELRTYAFLILILSLSIIFTTLGVDWINSAFEDYFIIAIRSIAIQCINLLLVFLFVKSQDDYYKYAFLMVLTNIVICAWNFIYCRRYVSVKIIRKCNFSKHIKYLLIFFANNLAITIYCNSDSTMIGGFVGDTCVGIYSVAVKVYTIIKSLLAAIYSVCIPRLSNLYANNQTGNANNLVNSIVNGLILVLFPAMAFLIVMAKPIIMILAGNSYIDGIVTLQLLSIALLFAILGGVVTNCINIPTGKEKITLKATVFAAIVNVVLNFALIPLYKQNGAAITTIIAEMVVLGFCVVFNKKEILSIINWKALRTNFLHAGFGGMLILIIGFASKAKINSDLLQLVATAFFTMIAYCSFLLIVRNKCALVILQIVRKKIKK